MVKQHIEKQPSAAVEKRGRGRPVNLESRSRLLKVASQEFLQHGYQKTSLEGIARLSGVSKVSIYRIFGSKEKLFSALHLAGLDSFVKKIEKLTSRELPPAELLYEVARYMYDFSFSKSNVAIARLAIAERVRFPHLAQALQDQMGEALKPVAAYFHQLHEQRVLSLTDAELTAYRFMALAADGTRFAMCPPASKTEREAIARDVVDLFMRAYRYPT